MLYYIQRILVTIFFQLLSIKISKYQNSHLVMNLRSRKSNIMNQPQPQYQRNPYLKQPQTSNLRDMMKDNYISNQQQMSGPTYQPNYLNYDNNNSDQRRIINQTQCPFIMPISHIQSESSIEVPDVQILQRISPRRRKIFNDNKYQNYNFSKKSGPLVEKRQKIQDFSSVGLEQKKSNNFGSIANTPSFGGQSNFLNEKPQIKVNQFLNNHLSNSQPFQKLEGDKKNQSSQSYDQYDFLGSNKNKQPNFGVGKSNTQVPKTNPIKTTEIRSKLTQSQANQPSFHTLASMKKVEGGNKNNNSSMYYSPNENFNESTSMQYYNSQLKHSEKTTNNQNANPKNYVNNTDEAAQKPKNGYTDVDHHIASFINQNLKKKQSSQYHQLAPSSNSFKKQPLFNHQISSQIKLNKKISIREGEIGMLGSLSNKSPTPVYESQFYQNLTPPGNFPSREQNQTGENILSQPFYTDPLNNNNYQNLINPNPKPKPNPNADINNMENRKMSNLFQLKTMNQVKNSNDPLVEMLFANILNDPKKLNLQTTSIDKRFQDFPKPHPLQHREGMRIDTTQPILVAPEPQVPRVGKKESISPFEQTEKQQMKFIPKRFDLIQTKVNKQEEELQKLQKKLMQTHREDLNSQKKLLNQLIRKEQELSLKQRQINQNLQEMKRLHSQNLMKKQQLIKYQLQLQQSKRIQELYKQNQRLYQELMNKQSLNKPHNPSTNPTYHLEQKFVPNRADEIAKKQYYAGDLLLSPFGLNPLHY